MSKSFSLFLCAYLMGCNTHDRTGPRYLITEYSSQVSEIFQTYFPGYREEDLGNTDGRTGGHIENWTDAGNDNTLGLGAFGY